MQPRPCGLSICSELRRRVAEQGVEQGAERAIWGPGPRDPGSQGESRDGMWSKEQTASQKAEVRLTDLVPGFGDESDRR